MNADVPSIEIIMVPEKDERVNPLGIKGIGEVGVVGVNAALANAASMPRARECATFRSGEKHFSRAWARQPIRLKGIGSYLRAFE